MTDLPTPTSTPPKPGQLTFAAPRRGKPPRHLADLTSAERRDVVESLGHKGFRAKQLSTHYFERLVDTPDEMTDLPKGVRDDLVRDLLPTLLTPMVQRTADDGETVKSAAAPRRCHRRVGAHAVPQPGHHLHLQPGRLRDELPLLRHRPGRPHPQPLDRRERRTGGVCGSLAPPGRARRRGRRGGAHNATTRLQRRLHGDG